VNIQNVEKKLREARFFLDKMREYECGASPDTEPFEFYLSAFLSAGRSVDYRLRHEQKEAYPTWRTWWDTLLGDPERRLIKFMVDDRNVEVHASGSSRSVKREDRELSEGTHRLASSTAVVTGPPNERPLAKMPAPAYSFTIAGTERKATEVCDEYLTLLERMVERFKAEHP
jgi:hypothetical protein